MNIRLLVLAVLPMLAACGDAADESDDPVADSPVVTPLPQDAQTVGSGVTAPAEPAVGEDATQAEQAPETQ